MYLLQISNNQIGFILLGLLAIAIIIFYRWLIKETIKQDRAEYPTARRMTREQKEKLQIRKIIVDEKLKVEPNLTLSVEPAGTT